jgi:superfamily II DNA or RNA helicase
MDLNFEQYFGMNIFYIFNHPSYEDKQRKAGGSKNIFDRFSGYITPFDTLGRFEYIIKCENSTYNEVELLFKIYSEENHNVKHRKNGGGIEHYDIIDIDNTLKDFQKYCKEEFDIKIKFLDSDKIMKAILQWMKKNRKFENKGEDICIELLEKIKLRKKKLGKEEKKEEEIEEEKFKEFYDYQQKTIDDYNGETGILSYSTGLGKTITCIGLLVKYFSQIFEGNQKICLWMTKKIDILRTQKDDFEILKKHFGLNIIDMISGNNMNQEINPNKINIILVNLDSLNKVKQKITPNICVYDECHGITGNGVYDYLKDMKPLIPIIGLSATPMKLNNKDSHNRIKEIFGMNDKIHFIDMITYVDAIDRDLVVPLKIKWLNNIVSGTRLTEEEKQQKIFENNFNNIKEITKHHKKIIFWTNTIKESQILYKNLIDRFKNIDVFISQSKDDINSKNIINFVKNKEKCMLVCVNRFKEGSNDKKLSCGIYYSYVNKQQEHVFLQQIGRLTRKSNNKEIAEFYQLLDNKDMEEKQQYIIDNILRYIQEMTDDFDKIEISSSDKNIGFKTGLGNKFLEIDFTNDNIIQQIDVQQIVNNIKIRKRLSYEIFEEILKTNNITNETYSEFIINYPTFPKNIYTLFPGFSWNNIIPNNNYYKSVDEYSDNIYELYEENKNYFKNEFMNSKQILNFYIKKDNKIPPMYPWLYYGLQTKDIFIEYFNNS